MKKVLSITALVILALITTGYFVIAPALHAMLKITEVNVDNNLTIFTGGGGNSAVYVTPDKSSVIIIDTKMGNGAKKLKAYIDGINPKAKVTIINTHVHADHVGGNKLFPDATVITGGYDNAPPVVSSAVTIKAGMEQVIKVPDDEIVVRNMGAAHSFADTIVYFKKRKLIMTGDLVFNGWHPVLIKQGGADIDKWIKTLEYLQKNYDVKTAVPGHGEVADANILQAQKSYFEEIKAALTDPVKLKALKEKYKAYYHIPVASGFDKTVRFMNKGN